MITDIISKEFFDKFYGEQTKILSSFDRIAIRNEAEAYWGIVPLNMQEFHNKVGISISKRMICYPMKCKIPKISKFVDNEWGVKNSETGEKIHLKLDGAIKLEDLCKIPNIRDTFKIQGVKATLNSVLNWQCLLLNGDNIIAYANDPFQDIKRKAFGYDLFSNYLTRNIHSAVSKFIHINVQSSILSKVKNTKLSINKYMIEESPYLQKGITFNLGCNYIAIWGSKKYLYFAMIGGEYEQVIFNFFPWEEIPVKITEKSIKRLFKKTKSAGRNVLKEVDKKSSHHLMKIICNLEEDFKKDGVQSTVLNTIIAHNAFTEYEGNNKYKDISHLCYDSFILGANLFCAFNTPQLRSQVKRSNLREYCPIKRKIITHRFLKWGTNKISYVYPKNERSKINTQHYVRPHYCKFYITNLSKYSKYNPIRDSYNKYSIIKWRSGCWKGEQEISYSLTDKNAKNYSQKGIAWIKYLENKKGVNIQHAERGGELRVELGQNKYYLLDGYCHETNTAYEFNGDYYHGNPSKYHPDDLNTKLNKTHGELYELQMTKEDNLRKMGFNVVSIWESDWDNKVRGLE